MTCLPLSCQILNSGIGCSLGSQEEVGHPLVCGSALLPQPGWRAAVLVSTFLVMLFLFRLEGIAQRRDVEAIKA